MTLQTNSYDVLNPEGGLSAINELLYAQAEDRVATLSLFSQEDGGRVFLLEVTKFRLEHDSSGLLLLTGETALGGVTGRLTLTHSVGKAGRVTVATEGVPE